MKKTVTSDRNVDQTRRRLLLGLAAAPFLIQSAPWSAAWATTQKNPDVVIVGAGAAGLGAAKTLMEKGISFVMIEAQSRIGGRAYVDEHTFGVPYDMGCHWLNYERINPWIDYGQKNGFTVTPVPK